MRVHHESPLMNTRCLVSWIEFCLVFHDDVQEGSEGFPYTKKETPFPAFAQGG